jgi:hypothetical protein
MNAHGSTSKIVKTNIKLKLKVKKVALGHEVQHCLRMGIYELN